MAISGAFVLPLIVALVSFVLTVTQKSWIVKLIFFIVALGAAAIAMGVISLDLGWVLLVNALLFITAGITAVRVPESVGNKVLGIVLIVLGIALVLPAIRALAADTTDTVWGTLVDSFEQGWATFADTLRRVFGAT